MEMRQSSLVFTVERSEPELIAPAKSTPYEFKFLSDLDSQIREQASMIHFFRNSEAVQGRDAVKVIKEAIAETLVHYYPLAGRILEGPKGKLIVECTGEGVLFTEANANVRLDQFGLLVPPFPGLHDLLYDVPGSSAILQCPLVLIQVTRLRCGGFVFACRANHCMMDAAGLIQFLMAVSEVACGASVPSVRPVWSRKLLNARRPQQVSWVLENIGKPVLPFHNMAELSKRCFFFGPQEITSLKNHLAAGSDFGSYTKMEMIIACLWRCRTTALNFSSDDEVYLLFAVNIRAKTNPPLPIGFYGNACVGAFVVTTAGKLCHEPFADIVKLVKTAKANVTDEFIRSTIDDSVKPRTPYSNIARTYVVSDVSRLGFQDIDFGWGKAVYGNPTWGAPQASFLVSARNERGENGIVVTVELPQPVMISFATELAKMTI